MLGYGKFLQASLDFLIVAFAVFLLVKGINSLRKKAEETPPAPAAPSREEVLLAEIRDLLKAR
jgi:large conductance mechanosensitive channel